MLLTSIDDKKVRLNQDCLPTQCGTVHRKLGYRFQLDRCDGECNCSVSYWWAGSLSLHTQTKAIRLIVAGTILCKWYQLNSSQASWKEMFSSIVHPIANLIDGLAFERAPNKWTDDNKTTHNHHKLSDYFYFRNCKTCWNVGVMS